MSPKKKLEQALRAEISDKLVSAESKRGAESRCLLVLQHKGPADNLSFPESLALGFVVIRGVMKPGLFQIFPPTVSPYKPEFDAFCKQCVAEKRTEKKDS
jgi:hypothetical protein